MTNNHDIRMSVSDFGPRAPRRRSAVLPETDHQQLQRHLDLCESARRPAWPLLAHVLHHKIMTTEPVTDTFMGDVATGGCRVIYSLDGGSVQTGLLVHSARSGSGSGVIPVSSLLGATLIGMRVGQRGPLLADDGTIGTVSLLGVVQPV